MPDNKVARPYRSELRAKAAAQTRTTILATAMRLFLERGYAKVTVNDIAQQANLATPTVYASTGGKSAILSTLMSELQEGNPAIEEILVAIRRCRSGQEVIAVTAHGTRVTNDRYHDILQMMVAAAAVDDAAAEIRTRSDQRYRAALSDAVRRLKSLRALKKGLTEKQAVDVLWFLFGYQTWHVFVYDQHWSWDEAESFLTAQATTALTATSP